MADFYGPSADHWHSWLTVQVVEEGDTYATLRFRGGPQAESWGFDITSGITTTLRWTDDGGAHSGSGGLHSATGKSGWSTLADYTYTFQKHHDARTIDASAKTVNASGYKNGTSTASGSIQIGARAHHTWSFNANGGSGAPGSVTKWVGERGYMPTQAPTRGVGWKFAGWSTDKSAASATYSAGAECIDDSDLTFYAVWERAFLPPTVRVTDARRTGADGSADPFGDHGTASFTWSVDRSVDAGNAVASLRLRHRKAGSTDWAEESASASGASGTCSKLVATDTGSAYEVQCEVTDSHGLSSTSTAVIPVATVPIDVGSYGASVGLLTVASDTPDTISMRGTMVADGAKYPIGDSGWRYLYNGGSSNGYVKYRRFNNLVIIEFSVLKEWDGHWTAGTLPAGYRPDSTVHIAGYTVSSNGKPLDHVTGAAVGSDGIVIIAAAAHVAGQWAEGTACWFVRS